MFQAKRLLTVFVPAALVLVGCPPGHVNYGPDGAPTSAEDLLKRIAVAESAVVSVKGEAKLRVDSPSAKGVVTLFAAVHHPAFVHLESLDFFGKPQGVLISDGVTFSLYDGQAGKYFRGPATAQNVARFLPIALPPAELAALLLGRAPRIPHSSAQMRFDEAKRALVLTLTHEAATQTLRVAPPSYRVIQSTLTGVDAYDLLFENIEDVGSATYPRRVVLTAPSAKVRVELNYKDVAVNELPDLTLYEMTPPVDVPIVEVDAAGVPRDAGALQ